jgi:hypothetical protein
MMENVCGVVIAMVVGVMVGVMDGVGDSVMMHGIRYCRRGTHEAAVEAARTPLEELEIPKEPSGGAKPMDEAHFAASPVFEVGARVRVLPVTTSFFLSRLASGCGAATVVAYDPHKGE